MSLPTFWTCEMRHEESGIWALDRQHWPQTSLSVVCKDRCVRTGECSSGSAGRLEKWVIAFPFDVLGYNYCMPLMWVSIGCQVEQLLFSPVCQGGFNLDNYQVKEALCISPSLSQCHLWPLRWQQSPALTYYYSYSTITFLTAFHISDGWGVCRQATRPDAAKRPSGTHCPTPPGPWACKREMQGNFTRPCAFRKMSARSREHALCLCMFTWAS